jgi:predicted HD phosphohydrolase
VELTPPSPRAQATVEEIIAACESMEGLPYDGEPVDQLQHALQCADIARREVGDPEFVVAALLHDVALVATDPAYRARLSDVSARTLTTRGGAMGDAEVREFEAHPDYGLAVRLREIDDRGKLPGLVVPGLDSYRADLAAVAERAGGSTL